MSEWAAHDRVGAAARARLRLGLVAYTKTRADAPEGFFAAEAAGLRWLAVPGGVRVVGVHDVSRTRLVIDRVETGPATAANPDNSGCWAKACAALDSAVRPRVPVTTQAAVLV